MIKKPGDHWADWTPETPEDYDEAATNLNGEMYVGSLVRDFHDIMAELYIARTNLRMFGKPTQTIETFQELFNRVRKRNLKETT